MTVPPSPKTTIFSTVRIYTRYGNTTDREVQKAYHELAMKWHPDKNAGSEDVQNCLPSF